MLRARRRDPMSRAHTSSAAFHARPEVNSVDIDAVQDRDCIDRAKFRYHLAFPLPEIFFSQFPDAGVTIREFSRMVPKGRDLFSIVKPGMFRADGLVRDTKMTVSFHGDPQDWPRDLMRNFELRLTASGYGKIRYVAGAKPKCAECPARFDKKCAGLHTDDAALPGTITARAFGASSSSAGTS